MENLFNSPSIERKAIAIGAIHGNRIHGNRIVGESVRSGKFNETMEKDPSTDGCRGRGRTNDRKENAHSERYHGANGGREIVEGRFKDSNRTARQTKQNRAEPGIN